MAKEESTIAAWIGAGARVGVAVIGGIALIIVAICARPPAPETWDTRSPAAGRALLYEGGGATVEATNDSPHHAYLGYVPAQEAGCADGVSPGAPNTDFNGWCTVALPPGGKASATGTQFQIWEKSFRDNGGPASDADDHRANGTWSMTPDD